jgi:hypothetical protein
VLAMTARRRADRCSTSDIGAGPTAIVVAVMAAPPRYGSMTFPRIFFVLEWRGHSLTGGSVTGS